MSNIKFGPALIFVVVSFFGIFIAFSVVWETAIMGYLVPSLLPFTNDTAIQALNDSTAIEVSSGYNFLISMLRYAPYILFIMVIIFIIVVAVRKEEESEYVG